MQLKVRGKLLVRLALNTATTPIANKYREGKLKRTLQRELTGRETVNWQTNRSHEVVSLFSLD